MSDALIPDTLLDGIRRLCQGELDYRLARSYRRDDEDTAAFLFNAIAEEVQQIVESSREQEQRLASAVEQLSSVLVRVAAGDLAATVPRDGRGDAIDVLSFLVNNLIAELDSLVKERVKRAEVDRRELERLVEERTERLRQSEESFRRVFEAAPVPMILLDMDQAVVRRFNARALLLFETTPEEAVGTSSAKVYDRAEDRAGVADRVSSDGLVDAMTVRLRTFRERPFWALVSAQQVVFDGRPTIVVGITDLTEQKRTEERLRELATTDALTATLNRRRLFEIAEEELLRAARYGRPLCVAMFDLDHFKDVNDRFGHLVGDEALRAVAGVMKATLRHQDRVGRWGGEEFAAVLPETTLEAATGVVERIRAEVEALVLEDHGERVAVTVSAGVVAWNPGETLGTTLRRADDALYQAKNGGRNRIVVDR